ncbi:hypothetical protein DFP72DRAFT_863250 [Ephemerocybe angulata]|uniref:Uncharacterized protein n=1 Tax=Ephemerocybe angulata TaxID=980116 RepID=A0A8H6LTZ8_9AGAR|nr:hypothetical protein DFP72DRAFT_863250 [Tulosesus angulatus]
MYAVFLGRTLSDGDYYMRPYTNAHILLTSFHNGSAYSKTYRLVSITSGGGRLAQFMIMWIHLGRQSPHILPPARHFPQAALNNRFQEWCLDPRVTELTMPTVKSRWRNVRAIVLTLQTIDRAPSAGMVMGVRGSSGSSWTRMNAGPFGSEVARYRFNRVLRWSVGVTNKVSNSLQGPYSVLNAHEDRLRHILVPGDSLG